MPSPTTTDLPKPRSWEELEDIVADVYRKRWSDPNLTRHGRQGQRQDGVDIYGQPEHLSRQYAAIQCKCVASLTIDDINAEVVKAEGFEPKPVEYLVATTVSRDAGLQREVRTHEWPFPVHVRFWEDISLDLFGYSDLVEKHFPGWVKKRTTKDEVLGLLAECTPNDFDYDDAKGIYTCRRDVNLAIEVNRSDESPTRFCKAWVEKFADEEAFARVFSIKYSGSFVQDFHCVDVDGYRCLVPTPEREVQGRYGRDLVVRRMWISAFQHRVGTILNVLRNRHDLDPVLQRAGIEVDNEPVGGSARAPR